MTDLSLWTKAEQIAQVFRQQGAVAIDTDVLQPADFLLDLYGEDIRARAYVTSDPLRGDLMLRPDYTVPISRAFLDSGEKEARYSYVGTVFRRQESDLSRANEYIQVGYERFGDRNEPEAEADVFCSIREALDHPNLSVQTGDIQILTTAVQGLRTTPERRAALMRHIWRPRRFRSLLEKYAGLKPATNQGQARLSEEIPFIGLRQRQEVQARLDILQRETKTEPISKIELDLLKEITQLKDTYSNVLSVLRDFAVDLPHLTDAIDTIERRLDALSKRGINTDELIFEGSFGRTSMEYYDGFVFGFSLRTKMASLQVASGGRYNALLRQLGAVGNHGAVGGVIRPALLQQAKEEHE